MLAQDLTFKIKIVTDYKELHYRNYGSKSALRQADLITGEFISWKDVKLKWESAIGTAGHPLWVNLRDQTTSDKAGTSCFQSKSVYRVKLFYLQKHQVLQ